MLEALVMTGAVLLVIMVSSRMNTPVPTETFVQSPEKVEVIWRILLKGAKFTADDRMTLDTDSPQKTSRSNPISSSQ